MPNLQLAETECIVVNFDHTTPSPMTLYNLLDGDIVLEAEVQTTEAFDDNSATIQLGTILDPNRILPALPVNQVDCQYNSTYNHKIVGSQTLILTINPFTSTQGAGCVILKIRSA